MTVYKSSPVNLLQVLYSCRAADTNQKQFKVVKKLCQKQEACQIQVTRDFFGNEECPDTDDDYMSLWLVYSCDGGGTDRTKTNKPKCDKSEVPTTVSPPKQTNNKCFNYDAGKMNQMDLPGCGGSTDIVYNGGCISIHKVTPCSPCLAHTLIQTVNSGTLQLQGGPHKSRATKAGQRQVPKPEEV